MICGLRLHAAPQQRQALFRTAPTVQTIRTARCALPPQFIAEPDGSLVQLGEGAHGVVYLAKMQDMYVAAKVGAAGCSSACTMRGWCGGVREPCPASCWPC